ncbi:MAG TPA: hypothetical protein VIK78_17750 [Ruminiclostridium sp.]
MYIQRILGQIRRAIQYYNMIEDVEKTGLYLIKPLIYTDENHSSFLL